MSLVYVLIILLLVFGIGGAPIWPHMASYGWGWYPSGGIGVVLLIVLILLLAGRL